MTQQSALPVLESVALQASDAQTSLQTTMPTLLGA